MNKSIDEFKNFVKTNPFLIGYIRSGQKSWQDFYEMYDLYGEDEDAWSKFLEETPSSSKTDEVLEKNGNGYWGDILNAARNIDVDKVQEGITSLQKTLGLFGDLFANKGGNAKTYNPRPLYRRFED